MLIRNEGTTFGSLASGSRRLRRLNESIMSSSVTSNGSSAHAWDPDHYSGFNAKTEQYFYKFLGEKECWPRCMRFTRLKFSAKPMAARVSAQKSMGNAPHVPVWKQPPTYRE